MPVQLVHIGSLDYMNSFFIGNIACFFDSKDKIDMLNQ